MRVVELLLNALVLIMSLYYLFYNIKQIKLGYKDIWLFIYPLFYFFYALAPSLQLFLGIDTYRNWSGAIQAMNNSVARSIYFIFVLLFSYFFWRSYRKNKKVSVVINDDTGGPRKQVLEVSLFILTCVPIGYTLITPSTWPLLLSGYGSYYSSGMTIERFPESLTMIAEIAFIIFLGVSKSKFSFLTLLASMNMIFSIYANGKRYIIFETIVLSVFVLIISGKIDARKTIRKAYFFVPVLVLIAYGYQILLKHDLNFYTYLSIDFSRDYITIFTIYRELIGEMILEYRWQSLFFLFVFFLPRANFPWKPYPFSHYATNAILNRSTYSLLGWGTTTTIFAEFTSNMGLIGLLVSPIFILGVIKFANKQKMEYRIILLIIVIRLLTVQLSALLMPVAIVFAVILASNSLSALSRRKVKII